MKGLKAFWAIGQWVEFIVYKFCLVKVLTMSLTSLHDSGSPINLAEIYVEFFKMNVLIFYLIKSAQKSLVYSPKLVLLALRFSYRRKAECDGKNSRRNLHAMARWKILNLMYFFKKWKNCLWVFYLKFSKLVCSLTYKSYLVDNPAAE